LEQPPWIPERKKRKDSCITYGAVLDYVGGSRQKYAAFVQEGIRQGFGTPWDDLLAQMLLGDRNFLEKLKGMKNAMLKGSAKDQPSYRMIQSVAAKALMKQAADYFRLSEADYQETRGSLTAS